MSNLYRYVVTVETDGTETDRPKELQTIARVAEIALESLHNGRLYFPSVTVKSVEVDPVAITDTVAILGPN